MDDDRVVKVDSASDGAGRAATAAGPLADADAATVANLPRPSAAPGGCRPDSPGVAASGPPEEHPRAVAVTAARPRAAETGLPKPEPGMRLVGYCCACRCFQELDGSCKDHLRHDRHQMAVILELPIDRPLYRIPAFNWGAFFMPPIWGAGHGQVFAVVLYPIWIMVGNLIWVAVRGQGSPLLAGIALAGTLAFMFFYARTANHVGYLRVIDARSPDEYVAAERRWAVAMGLVAAAMIAFATWYNLTLRA